MEDLEKKYPRIYLRHKRQVQAHPEGIVTHDGDCGIYRLFRICTCGLHHALLPITNGDAEKIYPKYWEEQEGMAEIEMLMQEKEQFGLWVQCVEVLRKINNVASLVRVVEDVGVLEESVAVCSELGADFWVNLQFVGGNLVEVNPRISSFVPAEGYSVPWLAVVVARGDDVSGYASVPVGSVMQRFFATRAVY